MADGTMQHWGLAIKEKIIQDIYLKAANSGSPIMLHKYCGFTCWIRWMSGQIFCQHDRQFCSTCGETWMRFREAQPHIAARSNGKCIREANDNIRKAVDQYRYILY